MKNPVGLQTVYWVGSVPNPDIYKIVDMTADSGFDVIEFKAGDFVPLSVEARRSLVKYIHDKGLDITVNGTGLKPERDTSSPDENSRRAGVDHLKHMLDLCADMGVKYFSGIPYGLWNARPEIKDVLALKKERAKRAIESLQEVAAHAQELGIIMCAEIVNRFEQYTLNTVEEGIKFCDAVGNPSFKLLIDTFHMNIEEDYIPESILKAHEAGHLGYIHVGESNRRIPTGTKKSNIDWQAIAQSVKSCGYDGPFVMEPFVLAKSPLAFSVSLWRAFREPEDIAGLKKDAAAGVKYLKSL